MFSVVTMWKVNSVGKHYWENHAFQDALALGCPSQGERKCNLTIVNSASYFSWCCSKGFPPSTVPSIYILLYSPLSPVTLLSNTPLPKFWDRLTPYSLCGSSWILRCGILGLQAVGAANLVEWEWGVNGEYDNKGNCVWQNLSNVYQNMSFYSW